jgi:putative DNA primase/helicase
MHTGSGYLVCCPLPSHGKGRGDRSPSLSIADGERGLMVHCFAGCDARDVLAELHRRGLLDGNGKPPQPSSPKSTSKDSAEYSRRQREKAAWLWSQRKPTAGTVAEKYLRSNREITCTLPATLGFLPARKSDQHPALISAFALPDEPEPGILGTPRNVGSVHLTLLKPDGSGKADVKSPKLIIGSPRGLPIVLAPPNDLLGLAITEGIEDGLTAYMMTGLGVWAAGAAPFMPALADVVPNYIEAVTIFSHPDKAGQDGARKLADGLRTRNIEIAVEGGHRRGG